MLEKASSSDYYSNGEQQILSQYKVHNSWLWEKLTPFIIDQWVQILNWNSSTPHRYSAAVSFQLKEKVSCYPFSIKSYLMFCKLYILGSFTDLRGLIML